MTKKHVSHETRALVLRQVSLSESQKLAINQATPEVFIKEKPGRGGKKVSYVETGYVISRLNATFSPAGWDFEILDQGQTDRKNEKNTDGEVWVRGKLTIIDHAKGYRVSKTQYGQHNIHTNVPIGDAFKAAASDCLKKCASLFGIAHDVYWNIAEGEERPPEGKAPAASTTISENDMSRIKQLINAARTVDVLMTVDKRISESKKYTAAQKKELHSLIMQKANAIETKK